MVKEIHQFSLNVIACQQTMGGRRWYIVVTIQDVEAAMTERPRELELVVAGDFNIDFLRDGRMERVLGDCGGDSDGGARISCRSLPTATSGIVQGLEDVGIGESR